MGKIVWLRPRNVMNTKDILLKNKIENYIRSDSFKSNDPRSCAEHILYLAREAFHSNDRFPIFALSRILGFKVYRSDMDKTGIEGYLSLSPGEINSEIDRVIVVNKNNKEGHQRFTVAHELWHYFVWLHEGKQLNSEFIKQESSISNPSGEETDASAFAAELLMPEREFRKVLNQYNDIMPNTTNLRLMSYFGVTETAVIRRRQDLSN